MYDVTKVSKDDMKGLLGVIESYYNRGIDHGWGKCLDLMIYSPDRYVMSNSVTVVEKDLWK